MGPGQCGPMGNLSQQLEFKAHYIDPITEGPKLAAVHTNYKLRTSSTRRRPKQH